MTLVPLGPVLVPLPEPVLDGSATAQPSWLETMLVAAEDGNSIRPRSCPTRSSGSSTPSLM